MKFVKAMIYALYLIVYGYSTYKTSVEPDNVYWGYICVFVFGFLFTWTVAMVIKTDKEKTEENL